MDKRRFTKVTSRDFTQKTAWSALDWFVAIPGTIVRLIAQIF
ncbi:hypothetical protein [Paenibacillus donghaensis]|nr:hypothetical protein [Paenibacillus donghaensis]